MRVAVNDIATTLATMLDVEPPSGSSGRVIILRCSSSNEAEKQSDLRHRLRLVDGVECLNEYKIR